VKQKAKAFADEIKSEVVMTIFFGQGKKSSEKIFTGLQ
jgi:hypothetical protein